MKQRQAKAAAAAVGGGTRRRAARRRPAARADAAVSPAPMPATPSAPAARAPAGGRLDRGSCRGRSPAARSRRRRPSATTIDALFAPLPAVETRGRAWLYINKQLKPVNLRLGITDGTYTEVLNDTELQQDSEVVTSDHHAGAGEPGAGAAGAGQRQSADARAARRGGPGGGPGGGGGRGDGG